MLALVGSRVCYRTIGRGVFHCERCGGDRPYRQRSGRRWAHVLGIPVASLGSTGEHLRCTICRTCYRVELLAVPTMDQMLVALLAGTKAAVLAMLRAGGDYSPAARRRGIQMIRAAGAADYDDGRLTTALADPEADSQSPGADGPVVGFRPAIEAFAVQLEIQAREWFLAKVVEVGLADGSLSAAEREVAGLVARYLGMSAARGQDVISHAEEAAQAG
jgi:tellurite resistance protein